jgi:hypothetical protein
MKRRQESRKNQDYRSILVRFKSFNSYNGGKAKES